MRLQGLRSQGSELTMRAPAPKLGAPAKRRRAMHNDLLLRTLDDLVSGFSEQVAIVDESWTILCANTAWKQMAKASSYDLGPGTDYREFLGKFVAKGHQNAALVFAGLQAVETGQTDTFE